jgi:LacI family transcriptional regulator
MKNLKSIAQATGFSTRTVTRALYNDKEISAETRDKIVKFCDEVNYTPNFAARSLKLKRTNSIGLVRFYLNIDVDNKRVAIMAEELAKAGYDILQGIGKQQDKEKKLIGEFKQKCDALIIYARPGVQTEEIFKFLKEDNYPFVLIDPAPGLAAKYPSISLDREGGIADAVESLGLSGKRKIAFLSPFKEYYNRFPGFQTGLERLGLSFSPEQVILVPTRAIDGKVADPLDTSLVGDMMQGGYLTALNNPAIGRDFNALFCYDDRVALGCLRGLYERGIKVPDQIAVVGFDDADFCAFSHVPLSTVRQPIDEMAHAAVKILLDQLSGRPFVSQQFSTTFVKRQSS